MTSGPLGHGGQPLPRLSRIEVANDIKHGSTDQGIIPGKWIIGTWWPLHVECVARSDERPASAC